MKYVKLTVNADPDGWYVKGTEVWSQDTNVRLTEREFKEWLDKDGNLFQICVQGIRKCNPHFKYEEDYMEKHGTLYRVDGECCSGSEFDVEYVDDDGTEEILKLLENYVIQSY